MSEPKKEPEFVSVLLAMGDADLCDTHGLFIVDSEGAVGADKIVNHITNLIQRATAAETERDALRTMLQMYNLGGYTDSVAIMTRALAAETERDALLKVYEAAEDFIGAQGTAYEDDQYRMLCGVVGAYNTTRGVHERRIG